ncbi:hypothetical protein NXS98_00390 [Fontisphaera persica]|uniref:hypothetical protein n=1 Tax=Fontisphaera persica TaxID=2974023 RepID=UPI0024BF3F84|nr:hypothetical protein [Fontisphaera persica]WCJ59609.1 hypothetical protein NXS98_00390 [Fontisphaera persica]
MGEGGIDPLGTEALADALAVRLAPGVRERQRHPRFLTAMAVSLVVCQDYDEEALAADRLSPPWLVFEWYVVEGLVRTLDKEKHIGIPGNQKAAKAISEGVPLSSKRYLKTPSIFGFHGVYRQLARTLGVAQGDRLGEVGYELLLVWSKEQHLEGFVGTEAGPGQAFLAQLKEALDAGLKKGATARSPTWAGWEFFSRHLSPYDAGMKEARFISDALLRDDHGFRGEYLEFLISSFGQEIWEKTGSEKELHQALKSRASPGLRQLLEAILAYEAFCRLCQDAFQDCLCELTRQGAKKVSVKSLAALPAVQRAARIVPASFTEVMSLLEPVDQAARFRDAFGRLGESSTVSEWVERLMEHHRQTQRLKPPHGKNPWFERFDDGTFIIRPEYRTDEHAQDSQEYVHYYRARSLWQFAHDLHLL